MSRKIALLLMALTACNDAPAPKKCADCDAVCAPFKTATCEPVQRYEGGGIAYVRCLCGTERVSAGVER